MDESRLFSNQRGRLPKSESIALASLILRQEKQKLPVNIIFTDDYHLAELNYQYRGKNKPTDVLSFNADPELEILGEIYISIDAARRQADDYNCTLGDEILRLVCHGTLHLCGYDHMKKDDEILMNKKTEFYLKKLKK